MSSSALQGELQKTVVFVTHDIVEAIKVGDQDRDPPRRRTCSRSTEHPRPRSSPTPWTSSSPTSSVSTTVRSLVCNSVPGVPQLNAVPLAGGPDDPEFPGRWTRASSHQHWFCTELGAETLERHPPARRFDPAHPASCCIAVGIGFVRSRSLMALHRRSASGCSTRRSARSVIFSTHCQVFRSSSILLPITGLTWTTIEIPLVAYTIFVLYRNTIAGLQRRASGGALESARGMGLTPIPDLPSSVELPLAVPAIFAGLRIATVSTISIATIAAFLVADGLGKPIFDALEAPRHLQDRARRRERAFVDRPRACR